MRQIVVRGIRLDYIHAEKPVPAQAQSVSVTFNVNIINSGVSQRGDVIEIPFVISVSTTPPIISIVLRGAVLVQADEGASEIVKSIGEGRVPEAIQAIIMQYAIFESSLIARELGVPPFIPVQMRQEQAQRQEADIRYA